MSGNTFFSDYQIQDTNYFYDSRKLLSIPDECPICHCGIAPEEILICSNEDYSNEFIKIIYKCPKSTCRELFISTFHGMGHYEYLNSAPISPQDINFKPEIRELSKNYCEIYNQAKHAEDIGLDQICGVGYRKALEFLIKDYLISIEPEKEELFKNKFLKNCIVDDIKNDNIKQCAERATWLGNDETHYVRKWETKDINDLKELIEITEYWIVYELKTKKHLASMSNGRK